MFDRSSTVIVAALVLTAGLFGTGMAVTDDGSIENNVITQSIDIHDAQFIAAHTTGGGGGGGGGSGSGPCDQPLYSTC